MQVPAALSVVMTSSIAFSQYVSLGFKLLHAHVAHASSTLLAGTQLVSAPCLGVE
jgi:hypothetical protein